MAKQRLLDFRGGINKKVSPHMIGDTQGQDAEDLEFSTVRLEGRRNLNASSSASGSFLYDVGDGSDPVWVSIYPTDADSNASFDPFIQYASDFAVWNRDLYVAKGATVVWDTSLSPPALRTVLASDHSGDTVRFLDGSPSATPLNFLPPNAVTATVSDVASTELVPYIAEVLPPAGSGQTGIVTLNTTATDYSTIAVSEFITRGVGYQTSSSNVEEAAAGGRDYYTIGSATTRYYVGGSGTSTFTNETTGYFYTRSNDTIQSILQNISTANNEDLSTTATGGIETTRNITQATVAHGVDINNVTHYEYSTTLAEHSNSVNNLTLGTLYGKASTTSNSPIVVGTAQLNYVGVDFNNNGSDKTVTVSNYTDLGSSTNTYYRIDGSQVLYYTPYGSSPYTFTDSARNNGQTFLQYTDSQTVYYAPTTTLLDTSLALENFYTRSGTGFQTFTNTVTWQWNRTFLSNSNLTISSNLIDPYWRDKDTGSAGSTNQFTAALTGGKYLFYIYRYQAGTNSFLIGLVGYANYSYFRCSLATGEEFYPDSNGWLKTNDANYLSANSTAFMSSVSELHSITHVSFSSSGFTSSDPFSNNTKYVVKQGGSGATISSYPNSVWWGFDNYDYTNGTITITDSNSTSSPITVSSQPVTTSTYTDTTVSPQKTYTLNAGTSYNSSTPSSATVGSNLLLNFTENNSEGSYVDVVDYTYTLHTRNESRDPYYVYPTTQAQATKYFFPATMTYSVWSDTLPTVSPIPATPAFYYDDARSEIYQKNTSSGTPATINDESRGDNWLAEDRSFSGPSGVNNYGYFLKSVRGSSGLPTLSTTDVRASFSGTDIMQSSALHSPQRINFTITSPVDNSSFSGADPDAYRLYRKDNSGTVDLGYIKPSRLNNAEYSTDIVFSFNSTNQQITISNLLSSKIYRLKWWAYQQSRVDEITFNSSTTTYSSKSNTTGVTIENPTTSVVVQLETSPNGDTKMYACDFWLEESILAGLDANTLLDDTFATIKCYDILYDIADSSITGDATQTVDGTSDFLDLFSSSLLNDGLGTSSTIGNAPDYCKFLKESNNFFFAVGSSLTDPALYGGTNKKGSFLFISEYNDPTTWHSTGYLQFDSEITGLHTYPGELIVWTSNGTYRVTGSRYDQMRKTKLATTEGMPDGQHRTASLVNNYLVWMSQSGICIYDGRGVTNLTRGRFETFGFTEAQKRCSFDLIDADFGTGLHSGQYDGIYYLLGSDETGYAVDFNLEGFPITKIDLKEGQAAETTKVPVLVYNSSENKLLSRRGIVAQGSGKRLWSYKTREFDGGAFGSLKLVKSVVVNGTGSGTIQVYLDDTPVFSGSGQEVSIDYTPNNSDQPARVYLPAKIVDSSDNSKIPYRVPIADVWSVEIIDWSGQIDWIDTEYEIVSGG